MSVFGAYVLLEGKGGTARRQVTLMATGSEVEIAVEARKILQTDGISTAVVSMPCWELFEAQSKAYKARVLGRDTVRVGIEASLRFGWDKYLGSNGGFIGMTGFGASAPASDLYEHFGITAANVIAEVKARL